MTPQELDQLCSPSNTDKTTARQWTLIVAAIFGLLAVSSLYGCMTLPIDYAKLSADQIREVVKDKGIVAQCAVANTPYGPVRSTTISVDKGSLPNGTVSVDDTCKITSTVTNQKP